MFKHFSTKYITQLLSNINCILHCFDAIFHRPKLQRCFFLQKKDSFVFIIAVIIGWYKFCLGVFCLAIEDVIFNCLVQRVDAGKRFEGLKRRRTIFIASLIPAAFEQIGNYFLAQR